MRPDYERMEQAHYITVDPETREVSWPPSRLEEELAALGLLHDSHAKNAELKDPDT
jgi:hypothetical protein